jgi:outer membrane lipoprotein-sorting protein
MKRETKQATLTLTILTLVVTLLAPFHAFGLDQPSGKKIMTLVHDRADGDDRASIVTMTLINKNGRKRVREMESFSKDYGKDRKSVMVFKEPADVRGTAFLSWDYDDVDRDDDKWLYLPAMKKVRRISGASKNEFFMGSDYTYDDMGKRCVDEDTHKLLGEERAMGHDCWKVESIPVDPEDLYTRKIAWVSKKAQMVVQAEYYDKDGLVKIYRALDMRVQDGFWTLFRSEMDNVSRNHKTVMETGSIRYDTGIRDNLFRVSAIQRGAVR